MTYKPKPIDTSRVKLPKELRNLTEKLAENVHEHWAKERISEGWSYGEIRDERNKRRPDLLIYSKLLDSEKGYDRRSAMETLKAIIALGYEVKKPSSPLRPAGPKKKTKRTAQKKARTAPKKTR